MTTHKAQGKTLPEAIVDIESCKGTEAPYVMLSRVNSLSSLLILRPFSIKRIRSRMSEDARKEEYRVDILRWQTIIRYGSPAEGCIARSHLASHVHAVASVDTSIAQIRNHAESIRHLTVMQDRLDTWDPARCKVCGNFEHA
jgi:hypothetical protein